MSMSAGYDAAIVDLDGTVYRGDRPVPGAAHGVRTLRETIPAVLFLSNKATERRRDYAAKLQALGIPAGREDVINSGWVTARFVADHYAGKTAYVVGEPPLLDEFREAGVETTRDGPGDLLVVSMDRGFTYEKLEVAMRTVDNGTPFLATNPDRTCPTETGSIPDAAGMIGAVEGVTGRRVDRVLGKPSQTVVEMAADRVDARPEDCLIVGDRLETDIEMGARAGMTTVLVLSGVTDEDALADATTTPDHVIDSVADIGEVIGR